MRTPSQGTCDPAPSETCHFGTLATGATGTVIVVQYGSPVSPESLYQGSVAVAASATADENDPDPTNNRANAAVFYYICDNAHDCILSEVFCTLLLQDWPSDRAGSQGTADESTLSSRSSPSAVSLFSKLRAVAGFLPHLPLYYDVRDEILASPDGQHLTNLYNTYGDEIFSLMENDQNLWYQGLYALEAWEPNLQALVDSQGSVTITALQVQAVDDFLTNLSATGSQELQQAIADERARLEDPNDFVGMTMEEARGVVVGYAAYLPTVQKP